MAAAAGGPHQEGAQGRGQQVPPPPSPPSEEGATGDEGSDEEGSRGVLLYYAYRPLGQAQEAVARWYEEEAAVGLVGRVRVALDGVNATLGGGMRRLRKHAALVEAHPLLSSSSSSSSPSKPNDAIDFKLCHNRTGARNDACRREAGFDRLRVSRCLEVVSLGPRAAAVLKGEQEAEPAAGGRLLIEPARRVTPEEFHQLLFEAEAAAGGDGDASTTDVVLLDARNLYESRIGRFTVPGVPVLAPPIRQFSDLPAWLDAHEEGGGEGPRLKGKRIAMYCTGGVRCERLSQYVKAKGEGYQDVVQLKGGIQRYLEAFPDSGGFFRGKNFVFDERVAVGPSSDPTSSPTTAAATTNTTPAKAAAIVGACLRCQTPWGDYGARARCGRCRMLVLACDACLLAVGEEGGGLVCERCCGGGGGGKVGGGKRARWKGKKGPTKGRQEQGEGRRREKGGGQHQHQHQQEEDEEEDEEGGVAALAGLFGERIDGCG